MDVDGEDQTHNLVLLEELTLNGRVVSMHAFRPKDEEQDRLFVLTEHKHFCVLGYDTEGKKVTTLACGNLNSVVGRHPESGIRSVIDPLNRMIAMVLYDGHFKLLPMNANGGFQTAFDDRILNITRLVDMVFLHGHSKPTLCLLHADDDGHKKIETFVVEVRDKELIAGPWKHTTVDSGAHTLIPVEGSGGVVVVAETTITYYGGSNNNNNVQSTASGRPS